MTEPAVVARRLPVPSRESKPFWDGASRHRLLVPCCRDCGHCWFPPSFSCRNCLSKNVDWRESAGRGRVFSFVTFHRVYDEAFASDIPYVVAIVELEEGARMLSNIVGMKPEEVAIGLPVSVVFDDVSTEMTLPKFGPVPIADTP